MTRTLSRRRRDRRYRRHRVLQGLRTQRTTAAAGGHRSRGRCRTRPRRRRPGRYVDTNAGSPGGRDRRPEFFSRIPLWWWRCHNSTVQRAAMAVATGVADVVVAYRAFETTVGPTVSVRSTVPLPIRRFVGLDNAFSLSARPRRPPRSSP